MVFAFVIVGLAALLYTLEPLVHEKLVWVEEESELDEEILELEAEKKLYLKALKDIDFEFASMKINRPDYEDLRDHYRAIVAGLMEDLEIVRAENDENYNGDEDPRDNAVGDLPEETTRDSEEEHS